MKFKIEIGGRGGEVAIGKVKREFYDIIEDQELDFDQYAWDSDFFEENDVEIDESIRPFEPGEWYECDNFCHNCGPSVDECYITVTDQETNNIIYDSALIEEVIEAGLVVEQIEEIYPYDELENGEVYFIGQSFEKGHFLSFELEDDSFDVSKLTLTTVDCDGWELVVGAVYNGETLEDLGELSTNGKGSEFQMILVGEEDEEEDDD